MPLNGRSALVTGADGAIGHAIACALGAAGAAVVAHACDRQGPALPATAAIAAAGGTAASAFGDLADAAAVDRLALEAISSFGGIDILVTVSTRSGYTPLAEVDEAAWNRALETDVRAPFLLGVALGRRMQAGGVILNVTGRQLRPAPDDVLSSVTAAGLTSLTQALAAALAPAVRVYCLVCGAAAAAGGADGPGGAAPVSTSPSDRSQGRNVGSLALQLATGRAAVASGTALAVT